MKATKSINEILENAINEQKENEKKIINLMIGLGIITLLFKFLTFLVNLI